MVEVHIVAAGVVEEVAVGGGGAADKGGDSGTHLDTPINYE